VGNYLGDASTAMKSLPTSKKPPSTSADTSLKHPSAGSTQPSIDEWKKPSKPASMKIRPFTAKSPASIPGFIPTPDVPKNSDINADLTTLKPIRKNSAYDHYNPRGTQRMSESITIESTDIKFMHRLIAIYERAELDTPT